jgi:hypothetical protein
VEVLGKVPIDPGPTSVVGWMKLFSETLILFVIVGFAARNNLHETWDLAWRTKMVKEDVKKKKAEQKRLEQKRLEQERQEQERAEGGSA